MLLLMSFRDPDLLLFFRVVTPISRRGIATRKDSYDRTVVTRPSFAMFASSQTATSDNEESLNGRSCHNLALRMGFPFSSIRLAMSFSILLIAYQQGPYQRGPNALDSVISARTDIYCWRYRRWSLIFLQRCVGSCGKMSAYFSFMQQFENAFDSWYLTFLDCD